MSILNDKTYESMDWLSQAVEPYHCELNDVLAELPNEYTLTVKDVLSQISRSYHKSLSVSNVVATFLRDKYDQRLTYDERDMLRECFKFETEGAVTVDAESGTMTGLIRVVKISNQIEDSKIKRLINREMCNINLRPSDCNREAISDLGLLLFEGDKAKIEEFTAGTAKQRLSMLMRFFHHATEDDSFKLRSVKAARGLIDVVKNFLETANPKSLGEIYRVVMMARRGQVIYTVGEKHG